MKLDTGKRPTLKDIAARAGVSAVTVSYVLNGRKRGPDRISAETRGRVLDAAKALDYVPNMTARNLQRKETRRVCLSVPRLSVPTYDDIAEQIQDAAAAAGYHMIVDLSRNRAEQARVVRQMQSGLADGLVLILEHKPSPALAAQLKTLARSSVALVVVSNHLEPDSFDVVKNTDLEACYEGLRHLIKSGRRRIACLAIQDAQGTLHERVDSYYRALRDGGLALDAGLVAAGAEARQRAYLQTQVFLSLAQPPDALFACTDAAALSAVRAIKDAGLQVPDDIAVLGAGNIIEGELSHPALSSTGPDAHDYSAVFDFLLTRLSATDVLAGRELVIPWSFKPRAST